MLQEQREEFAARNAGTTELMKEIHNLADIKDTIGQLVESTKGQTVILERLVNSLNNQHKDSCMADLSHVEEEKTVATQVVPQNITYMVAIITLLSFMAFGLYVYNSFVAKPKIEVVGASNELQQTTASSKIRVVSDVNKDQTVKIDPLETISGTTQK